MIQKQILINRKSNFWHEDLTPENVGVYCRELKQTKNNIEKNRWDFEKFFDMKKEFINDFISAIDEEIKYCNFYFEYRDKITKDPEINKWIFKKQKDREDAQDWKRRNGDCHYFKNGRVIAIINVKKREKSTKISLEIINDSEFIRFIKSDYGWDDIGFTNVRSEEGINKAIEKYKRFAGEYFGMIRFPFYCEEWLNFQILSKLLHVGDDNINKFKIN